jgi:hypothetical protein
MWSRIAATPCYRESGEIQRQWPDLLAAVARRDALAIVRSGTLLLEQPDRTLIVDAEYIVTAVAAAHLQLGDVERARAVLALVPLAGASPTYHLPLQQLNALAQHAGSGAAEGIE